MTKIRTSGLSKIQQKISREFSNFVMRKFFPRSYHSFSIKIKGICDLVKKEETYADCMYEYIDPRPKDFVIRIDNNLDNEMFVKTLAHELTHVKQWAKGEMKIYERNFKVTRWQNQKIRHDLINYFDMPWEIEAHGREHGLYAQYIETYEDACNLIDGTTTDYKLCDKQLSLDF